MADEEIQKKIKQLTDIRSLLLYSIISALTLVVGLFWNEAIKATIEQIVPKGDSLYYKYLAAIIVTVVIVISVYILIHGQRIAEKRLEKIQKDINEKKLEHKARIEKITGLKKQRIK